MINTDKINIQKSYLIISNPRHLRSMFFKSYSIISNPRHLRSIFCGFAAWREHSLTRIGIYNPLIINVKKREKKLFFYLGIQPIDNQHEFLRLTRFFKIFTCNYLIINTKYLKIDKIL